MSISYELLSVERDNRTAVALLCEGELLEYYEEECAKDRVVGSVLLGKVERVLPDLKAAFVNIGQKLSGFLPLREMESFHKKNGALPLMSGQKILVQVKKAPKGGKGAFLTRDISLAGQFLLLMPNNCFVGVSKRVTNEDDSLYAKQLGESLSDHEYGIIVREAALSVPESEVLAEKEKLLERWQTILQTAENSKAPSVIWQDEPIAQILKRDHGIRHTIIEGGLGRWRSCNVDGQVSKALQRRVELKDGGSLVIDEREALHTIDVNSGKRVKAQTSAQLPLEENLNAVPEIARQIRLRQLSGIILIDFIDMPTDEQRVQVMEKMADALRDDRMKTVIHGFTKLGLMEMTRKRMGESLRDMLTLPCDQCHETGRVRGRGTEQ